MASKGKLKSNKPEVFYFHGFASGPESEKAKYFKRKFKVFDIDVHTPDLNQPDFQNLHLEAMVNFAKKQILSVKSDNVILMGSSLGALIALILSNELENIRSQVLIAPAVTFPSSLTDLLGEEKLMEWKQTGIAQFYHHQKKTELPLSYSFVESFRDFNVNQILPSIPTQIFHGAFDERIPFLKVEEFAKSLPESEFHLLETDHGMINKLDWMWREIIRFLDLDSLKESQDN
ncbi:MAG: alpha/beta fold hydrolase [Calditrichia bacterium]